MDSFPSISVFLLSELGHINEDKERRLFSTLLHLEQPKLYGVLAVLSTVGLTQGIRVFRFD